MLLLCGATGFLGGKVAERLVARGVPFRVLLRPSADAAPLAALGAEIARGDLRRPASLDDVVADVTTVITTVSAIGRALGGEKLSIDAVDRRGTINLIEAAERSGVGRFVYVSVARADELPWVPLARAKLAVERRLRRSPLFEVIVRPEAYQELWLAPASELEIIGGGDAKTAYVAVDDVAEAVVRLSVATNPPRLIELSGPEALTRNEVADAFERAAGRPLARRHVSRRSAHARGRALALVSPARASALGLALLLDGRDSSGDAEAFRALGIEPRAASQYLRETVRP